MEVGFLTPQSKVRVKNLAYHARLLLGVCENRACSNRRDLLERKATGPFLKAALGPVRLLVNGVMFQQ